jgi:hypothetical protein
MSWIDTLITAIEAGALVGSLIFVARQVSLERETLNRSIEQAKYSTIEKLMSDFSSATFKLVENATLRDEFVSCSQPENWGKYDKNNKALFFYFDSLIGLIERVWTSHTKTDWLDKAEWNLWFNWMVQMAKNPIFRDVFKDIRSKKLYEESFMDEVQRAIDLSLVAVANK